MGLEEVLGLVCLDIDGVPSWDVAIPSKATNDVTEEVGLLLFTPAPSNEEDDKY